MFSTPFDIFRILGMTSMGVIVLAIIYSVLQYRGKRGERFSLLNHFISELGEMGVSKGARVFNVGLAVGGLATLPFVANLGIAFGSILGWLGTVAGIVATLGVAAVGIFPMNNLNAHTMAAMTYFRAGLAMVFFFGLAVLFQPAGRMLVPPMANLLSLLAFLAYGSFLSLPRRKRSEQESVNPLDPEQVHERPRVWVFPILEWAVFFATVAWLFGMALLAQI
jgi:hypothetical membrane protein